MKWNKKKRVRFNFGAVWNENDFLGYRKMAVVEIIIFQLRPMEI